MADATSLLDSGREATANDVTWATKEAHAMLGVDAVDDQPSWLRRNPLYWALVILIVVCVLPGKWLHALVGQGGPCRADESKAERNARVAWCYASDGLFAIAALAAMYDAFTARTDDALYAACLNATIATLYVGGNVAFLAALRHKDSVAVRAGVAANYAFAAGLAALLGLWIVNRHGHHWTVLWTRVIGVAFCLSVVPDFRPLWREHAPAAGERLHLPTLAAAGGAAVVVIAALALAATDPKAEDVVLDMFAGV